MPLAEGYLLGFSIRNNNTSLALPKQNILFTAYVSHASLSECRTHHCHLCITHVTVGHKEVDSIEWLCMFCSAGIRTMMITGDYHHTGIAVARDVGMLKSHGHVVVIDTTPLVPHLSEAKLLLPPAIKSVTASLSRHTVKRSVSFALKSKTRSTVKRPAGFAPNPNDSDHVVDQNLSPTGVHAADTVTDSLVAQECPSGSTSTRSLLSGGAQSAAEEGQWVHRSTRHGQTPVPFTEPPLTFAPLLEGLRFLTAQHQPLEASEALHALAEGQMQCAVTGDALTYLLQHHDLSVLETVMRNVIVFSRMKPHQKGQVMDLLGMPGIHQLFQGQARYIPVRLGCHAVVADHLPSCMS